MVVTGKTSSDDEHETSQVTAVVPIRSAGQLFEPFQVAKATKKPPLQKPKKNNQAPWLFRLPVELRIQICKECMEEKEMHWSYDPQHADDIGWSVEFNCRALMQVCRQLRHELLPIFKGGLNVHVSLDEVETYMAMWLDDVAGSLPGPLTMSLTSNLGEGLMVDITRLMNLRSGLPNFSFYIDEQPEEPPIQEPTNFRPPKANLRYFEADIKKIIMYWWTEEDDWVLSLSSTSCQVVRLRGSLCRVVRRS